MWSCLFFVFFFFNDTATTEIYTLSLHDALLILSVPKSLVQSACNCRHIICSSVLQTKYVWTRHRSAGPARKGRSIDPFLASLHHMISFLILNTSYCLAPSPRIRREQHPPFALYAYAGIHLARAVGTDGNRWMQFAEVAGDGVARSPCADEVPRWFGAYNPPAGPPLS